MGRPTKCTPEVVELVCEALSFGVSWEAAAAHAGVGVSTVHKWLAQAADDVDGGQYREFLERTTSARDAAEVRMARIVVQAAEDGDAKAAQWWLERRRSDSWSSKQTVTVDAPDPSRGIAALLGKLAEPGEGG
jgi:transposase-like protein